MLMLTSGNYTFSHSHANSGNITHEITSNNYTKGGKRVLGTAVLIDSVDNEAVLSGNPVTFSGITATVAYGIVYISGSTPASSYLLGQLDFGTQTVTAADFTVNWNTEGIYNLM
jgi:hypothetical protein